MTGLCGKYNMYLNYMFKYMFLRISESDITDRKYIASSITLFLKIKQNQSHLEIFLFSFKIQNREQRFEQEQFYGSRKFSKVTSLMKLPLLFTELFNVF